MASLVNRPTSNSSLARTRPQPASETVASGPTFQARVRATHVGRVRQFGVRRLDAKIPLCLARFFLALLSTRTAAARRCGPRTRSRRSITALPSAPTASSSTSISPATASSSCTTTPTLERTTDGTRRDPAQTAAELAAVDAGYWFRAPAQRPAGSGCSRKRPSRRRSSRFAGRASACRRCARCWRATRVPLIIELKTHRAGAGARARSTSCARPVRSTAWRSDRSAWRVLHAARAVRAADRDRRRAGRDALGAVPVLGRAGRSAGRRTASSRCPSARAGRRSSRRGSSARAPRGPAGEGLDRRRPRATSPAARLGRRRHHQRSAGCGGGRGRATQATFESSVGHPVEADPLSSKRRLLLK